MSDLDVEAFRAWLVKTGFREQTIELTLRRARQMDSWSKAGKPVPVAAVKEARRLLDFLAEIGDGPAYRRMMHLTPIAQDVVERNKAASTGRRFTTAAKGRKARKKTARSIPDGDWAKLLEAVRRDESGEAIVLDVIGSTALRIGDVLRIEHKHFLRALTTGLLVFDVKGGEESALRLDGARDAWARLTTLWAGRSRNVAELISGSARTDSNGAAYTRVRRKLLAIAEELGLEGRMFLHRMRRTVGVQALRVTKDIGAVQQLLRHRSQSTTLGYLDEARPDAVAELQRKISDTFGTDKKKGT